MDVSSVGSSPQSSVSDLTQLIKMIDQTQIDMVKKMLKVQTELTVSAEKMVQADQVQGSVDYYA